MSLLLTLRHHAVRIRNVYQAGSITRWLVQNRLKRDSSNLAEDFWSASILRAEFFVENVRPRLILCDCARCLREIHKSAGAATSFQSALREA